MEDGGMGATCRDMPIRLSQRMIHPAVDSREAAADIIFAEFALAIQRGTSESRAIPVCLLPSCICRPQTRES